MEFDKLILEIASRLAAVSEYKKSMIQADLADIKEYIEEEIFKLKIAEHNYETCIYQELSHENIETLPSFCHFGAFTYFICCH